MLADFGLTNWLQALDILLVAVLFYYLFISVRGTKTAFVIQGIIVLAVLYFICQRFKLIALVFILEKLVVVVPFALFIIFAPEIRKAIEKAGERFGLIRWLMPQEHETEEVAVKDTLAEAAIDLSARNVGALFVIERHEDVSEYIVPGTALEAIVSERLLVSIFDRHNPLHDGAVLIRRDRLHSAGNFLPISEATFLSEELGTRHRAAVGLTERCDAVVVVVSEERGELSVACNGRLARRLTPEHFIEQLAALVEPNENYASIVPRASFI